jgi:hypothetical protein
MSMKITIENDKNVKVSIENATPEESGKILSQVFGYDVKSKEGNITLEPAPTPVRAKYKWKAPMTAEGRKNVAEGIRKYWAKQAAMKQQKQLVVKHKYKYHAARSRRINGAPETMLTPSNQIKYKSFLGKSLTQFVKDNPNTPSEELVELVLAKLPIDTATVRDRIAVGIGISRPSGKTQ